VAQRVDPDALNRHGRHHVDAEFATQARNVDLQPALGRLVPHVERDDERQLHLGELQRQTQRALDVLGVPDDHNRPRIRLEQHVARYAFIVRRRVQ
jgi:hypothetical protein